MGKRRTGPGRTIEGDYLDAGFRFALIVSRFNEYITQELLKGCVNTLNRHGVPPEHIEVIWVPGSFEIPTAMKVIVQRKRADALIGLGCVIRGDTAHYDNVCRETARGISEVGRRSGVPCIFGVLTTDTIEQAIERAGTKMGHAGRSAALAALEMASLVRKL